MSERNTGLFLSGHRTPESVARAFRTWPGLRPGDLDGEEAPRLGHGHRQGRDFSLVALRLFEVGGLLLLDQPQLVDDSELESHLGRVLSAGGEAVFLRFEEQLGAGGFARFRDGALVDRRFIDGRPYQPVIRDRLGERPLHVEDEEAWIWAEISDAVEEGARSVLGDGIRSDRELAPIIAGLEMTTLSIDLPPPPGSPPGPPPPARRGLRALVRRLAGR